MFEKIIAFLFFVLFMILIFLNIKTLDSNKMGGLFSKKRYWKDYHLGKEKPYGENKKRSKGEQECLEAAEKIFGVKFITVRPNWLKNPKTGKNLEIDVYNDKIGVGIEYQGYQHIVYPNKFHKTREEFEEQLRRDKFKLDKCNEKGVYLIRVYDDCHNIEKFIYENAPKDCISKKYKPT